MTTTSEPERLFDKDEIAHLLSVSPRTIKSYVAKRKIPVVKISNRLSRYSPSRVLAALQKLEIKEVQ